MTLIDDLRKARDIRVECPGCGHAQPAPAFTYFDAVDPLPPRAAEIHRVLMDRLKQERDEFRKNRQRKLQRARAGAASATVGKIVEKIAPELPGFPVDPLDCRALFEPIDYIIFNGLARKRRVESLTFIDVKSGGGRLQTTQKSIKTAVEAGHVSFRRMA